MSKELQLFSSDLIQPELSEGENVLWSGRPDTSRLFSKNDIWPFLTFIPFLIFSIDMDWVLISHAFFKPEFFFASLPFLSIVYLILIGRFQVKQSVKLRTY